MDQRKPGQAVRLLGCLFVALQCTLAAPGSANAQAYCPDNLEQTPSTLPCGGSTADARLAIPPERDAGAAPRGTGPRTTLGNPVSVVTGTKFQEALDFAIPGSTLSFRRHYSSAIVDENIGLGFGWRHTFAVTVRRAARDSLEIADSRGRRVIFAPVDSDGVEDSQRFTSLTPHDGYLERVESTSEDGEGQRYILWHVPDGRTLRFHGSYLVRIEWPDQRSLALRYVKRRLASVKDETGRTLQLEYTSGTLGLADYERSDFQSQPGHLTAVELPDGTRIGYDYDGERNLVRARFADGTHRRYHYEHGLWPNHLTGLTERTGQRIRTWDYDDGGRATLSESAEGVERVSLRHEPPDTVGEIGRTLVTASDGAQSVYTWRRDPRDGRSQLLSSRGAGCATCPATDHDYVYDAAGRLASETRFDDRGAPMRVIHHAHDELGRLVDTYVTAADGSSRLVVRYEYQGTSAKPTRIARPSVNEAGERIVEVERDAGGRVVAILERGFAPTETGYAPIERRSRFEHDVDGGLVAIDGPREDVDDNVRLERDEHARLVAIHPPAAPSIRFDEPDALGRPTEVRIGTASPYRLEYGAHGQVRQVSWRGLNIRQEHDAEGRPIATVDTDGRRTALDRDAAGRPLRLTDDIGRVSTLEHDAESRVLERTLQGPDGDLVRSLSHVLDARGRPRVAIEREQRPGGNAWAVRETAFEHDVYGQLVGAVDVVSGARTTYLHDPLARRSSRIAADGTRTLHTYDALGRATSFTDQRDSTTTFLADDFGRVVRYESPDTGVERYTYDAAGNRLRRELANGRVTAYAWDAAGRLVERRDDDDTARWRHDPTNGRLVEARNKTSIERFAHDGEGQKTRHEREIDGRNHVTSWEYDDRGRVTVKRLPDGQRLRYHYHEMGANRGTLRAITRTALMGLAHVVVGEIDLDARDGASSHLALDGRRTTASFDRTGRPLTLDIDRTIGIEYTFDHAGRIAGIDENGALQRYGYTSGRLSVADTLTGHYRYAHDAAGNRISRDVRHADGREDSERLHYAAPGDGNRLVERFGVETGEALRYRYDAHGSPVAAGTLRYTYDAARRPVSVRRNDTLVARYGYNAFGERVTKTVSDANGQTITTHFLYDGPTLTAEIAETGTRYVHYVHLPNHRPVAKIAGREMYAIHTDHLGAPRLVGDAAGDIVWRARYTPFGKAIVDVDRTAQPLRLPGQYADAETGTHYNYLRDYDPATGRYLTSDPIGLKGGTNIYAYVGGRPLTATDPRGLVPLLLAIPAGSAFVSWLGGALAVTPVGAAGGVALVALAGVYWHVDNGGVESSFEASFGRKADQAEYDIALASLRRFSPGLDETRFLSWNGTWGSYFQIIQELESAQRAYIAQHERFHREHPGICTPFTDLQLYDEAVDSVREFDEARRLAADGTATGSGVLANPERDPNENRDANPPPLPTDDSTPAPTPFPATDPTTDVTGTDLPVAEQGDSSTSFPATDAPDASILLSEGHKPPTLRPGDTRSDTRHNALRQAKIANGVPVSAQPLETIYPNTPEGRDQKLDSRNVVLYVYFNSRGQEVYIREDKAAVYGGDGSGDQDPHFNAGLDPEKLLQHHYFSPSA